MDIDEIKKRVSPVLSKYPITEAYLFGSVVRNEDRPDSDVDILVKFSKLGGLFQYVQIKLELQEALGGRKVDLVQEEALRHEYRGSVNKDKLRVF